MTGILYIIFQKKSVGFGGKERQPYNMEHVIDENKKKPL